MARRNGGNSNFGGYGDYNGNGDSYAQPSAGGDAYGRGAYRGQDQYYQQDARAYQGGYAAQDPYAQQGQYGGGYGAPQDPYYARDPYAQAPQAGGYAAAQGGYGDPYAQQRGGYGQDPYASQQRASYQQDPYYAQSQQAGQYGTAAGAAFQYQQDPQYYGQQPQRPARGQRQDAAAYQTPYPVGSGRTYASSRPARDAGAPQQPRSARGNVASRADYAAAAYAGGNGGSGSGGGTPAPKAETPISRRKFLTVAGGAGLAALVGLVGIGWYTHRAVACTINGSPREAPINSKAQDLIDRGYIYPKAGNLVSIANAGETPQVLEAGAGNPYTLRVNGEPVDPASYRLRENDQLEFTNGTDVVEEVIVQNTEIPCGIRLPDESVTYYLSPVGYVAQWGRNGITTVETGKVSGITIDRGVTQEPQDLIIATSGVNPADGRMLVSLTFDDGPDPTYTPIYLDILARYGVKATFFNLGQNLEAGPTYQSLAQRIVSEGHQLASHTYSHTGAYGLLSMTEETRNWEISRTFELINQITGQPSNVMRPPFGEFDSQSFLQYLASGGTIAYSAFWGVDSSDWERPGVEWIIHNCTANLQGDNYNGAIILMHDSGGNRDQDVAALPTIIETFLNAGYELVTMNELLASDPTFPEWVWNPSYVRPADAIVPPLNEWAGWRRYWS